MAKHLSNEKRTDWLMRQFVQAIEFKLKIGDMEEPVARKEMTDRMVPFYVQQRIVDRVGISNKR